MIESVIERHAEETAILWSIRRHAVVSPGYDLRRLAMLEERIDAHLDGLSCAGERGAEICIDNLRNGDGGEVFACALFSVGACHDGAWLRAIEKACFNEDGVEAIVTALAWFPTRQVGGRIERLVSSRSEVQRRIGLGAAIAHGLGPVQLVRESVRSVDLALRARGLRGVGELGRRPLLSEVMTWMEMKNEHCRFAAAWSAALLGAPAAGVPLKEIALAGKQFARIAADVAIRCMVPRDAHEWIATLVQHESTYRLAIIAIAALGDPAYIDGLLRCAAIQTYARAAGDAFALITGVDLVRDGLATVAPAGFEGGPTDDPHDRDVTPDPDAGLPWPDVAKLNTWWAQHRERFSAGTRYLSGRPVSIETCKSILRDGNQRRRAVAALEWSALVPGRQLFDVTLPTERQRERLQRMGT